MTVIHEDEFRRIVANNPSLQEANPGLVVLAGEKPVPARKYHNIPTEYKGRRYDSIKEAQYARSLDLEMQTGEVICWAPQVTIQLYAGITIRADFLVVRKDWEVEIVDVKGGNATKTPLYRAKKKMFKARFGREIKEV